MLPCCASQTGTWVLWRLGESFHTLRLVHEAREQVDRQVAFVRALRALAARPPPSRGRKEANASEGSFCAGVCVRPYVFPSGASEIRTALRLERLLVVERAGVL